MNIRTPGGNWFLMAIAVVAVLVLALASCTQSAGAPTSSTPIKLRYSNGLPPTHHVSVDQKWWADEVAKRTDGKVEVEVYVGGELYSHTAVVDAATTGAIEMGLNAVGHWAGKNPVFNYPNYFFLIRGTDHWLKVKESVRSTLEPLFEKQGVKMLHFWSYGESGYIGNKPAEKPADFKGLIVRGVTEGNLQSIEVLGATGAAIAEGEVYDAMAKGAISGAFTGYSTMYSRKQYEVGKYVSGPFWFANWLAFISLDTWNKLPKDVQNVIIEVSKEAETRSLESMKKYDKESIDALRGKANVKIFNAQEIDEWAKAIDPVYQKWLKDAESKGFGSQAKQLYDAVVKAAK